MKLNPPNAHRSQIKICEKRQTRNVHFRFMPNAFRILKPIQKSSKCVWVFRSTGANAVAKNQTHLAYEDKRDLYCTFGKGNISVRKTLEAENFQGLFDVIGEEGWLAVLCGSYLVLLAPTDCMSAIDIHFYLHIRWAHMQMLIWKAANKQDPHWQRSICRKIVVSTGI